MLTQEWPLSSLILVGIVVVAVVEGVFVVVVGLVSVRIAGGLGFNLPTSPCRAPYLWLKFE